MDTKILRIVDLCTIAHEKGKIVSIRYNGESFEFIHQEVGTYKIIINIISHSNEALNQIIAYLEGLIE